MTCQLARDVEVLPCPPVPVVGKAALRRRLVTALLSAAALAASAQLAVPAAQAATGTTTAFAEADARVTPTVETQPVPHSGDAADDPAIWVNRNDPSSSTVIGTDKRGGLAVYDLSGRELQYLSVGEINNVDVRDGFRLGRGDVSLVTAGNRSTNTIDVFAVDEDTRRLRDVTGDAVRPSISVYGSCMYRSPESGRLFVFVTSKSGDVEQWELIDGGSGRVEGTRVRTFHVGTQLEGCVADDELAQLYIGEESVGIWKYGAEAGSGSSRSLVAETSSGGPLVADVEGLTIAYGENGSGYLLASSQGNSSFVVYERQGSNAFVKTFKIAGGHGIDATQGTDGIDVTAAYLGSAFPSGVFVAQDHRNDGNQNFKLVPLEEALPQLR